MSKIVKISMTKYKQRFKQYPSGNTVPASYQVHQHQRRPTGWHQRPFVSPYARQTAVCYCCVKEKPWKTPSWNHPRSADFLFKCTGYQISCICNININNIVLCVRIVSTTRFILLLLIWKPYIYAWRYKNLVYVSEYVFSF